MALPVKWVDLKNLYLIHPNRCRIVDGLEKSFASVTSTEANLEPIFF
ncbi:hypothetical protein BH11CYA1_BH11CYA1_12270 [soil metagenome]